MPQIEKLKFSDLLATTIVLSCFTYLFTTSFAVGKLDESSRSYINQIGMACVGLLTFIAGYFFGSSKTAASKDATILSMQQENKDSSKGSGVTIQNAENVTDKSTAHVEKVEILNTQTTTVGSSDARIKELETKRDSEGLSFEEEKELTALKSKTSE